LVFLAWKDDPAAMNIAHNVLKLCERSHEGGRGPYPDSSVMEWRGEEIRLTYIEESPLYLRGDELGYDPRAVVVLSKHKSEAGIPCLTVHCTGNIGDAAYGGEPRKVSVAPAQMMKAALLELNSRTRQASLPYSVSYEVTHHGPTVNFPIIFVEIGSSEGNWRDPLAGEVVARAALAAASAIEQDVEVKVGLGGPHYAPLFTSMTIRDGTCFGHMVSWHHLPDLDERSLAMLAERNVGQFGGAIVDWKGLRKEKKRVISLLENAHIRFIRI